MAKALRKKRGRKAKVNDLEPFAKTYEAFSALIAVETTAQMIVGELRRLKKLLNPEYLPEGLWYVAPPRSDADDELRSLIEERRSSAPERFRPYWRRMDEYHVAERRWRDALDAAKRASDAAAIELDSPDTPPLQRVTVAIKRSLQRMGGSIPSPMVIGDAVPLKRSWIKALQGQLAEVSTWVDELRLLVIPRSPALGYDARGDVLATWPAPPRKKPGLRPADLDVLEATALLGAHSEERAVSIEEIHEMVGGSETDSYTRKRCGVLVREKYLRAKKGRSGGHSIMEKGLQALREHGRSTAPRNSAPGNAPGRGTNRT